jgi:hypothetical protein
MSAMQSILSLGLAYVSQGDEDSSSAKLVALLDRDRATLPLRAHQEFLQDKRRRDRLKDVCRLVRAARKKGQRLSLSVNTDFAGALRALKEHHSDSWVGPNLEAVWKKMAEAKTEHGSATLPITVRQLEAISRIAESFAKMQQKDEVLKYHVEAAMELFTAATMEASSNPAMGGGANGANSIGEIPEHERQKVRDCEKIINVRVAIGAKIGKEQLFNYCMDQSIDLPIARKTLNLLIRRLTFEEAENGKVKRIN